MAASSRRRSRCSTTAGKPPPPVPGLVRLQRRGQRVRGQGRREQHGAAVQGSVGYGHAQLGVAGGRVVEVAQRRGQVAGGERDQRPVLPCVGDLESLAGPGVKGFGRQEAGPGPGGRAHGQISQGGGGAGAR